jgi:osmoprotectant transport system permease protein
MMLALLSSFGDALTFIFEGTQSRGGDGIPIGGLGELSNLAGRHFLVSFVAVAIAIAIAVPIGLQLGHLGKFEFLAVGASNVGRAVPALALLAVFISSVGVGFTNVCIVLTLLAIPPILTNAFVGVRQVDREIVDAARGQGMTEGEIIRRVELPLALPIIFGGIRISVITVLATAIIAPLASYDTLGTPIISPNVYGTAGQIGAALTVTVLTLAADGIFALIQRLVTPQGLKANAGAEKRRSLFSPRRRVASP